MLTNEPILLPVAPHSEGCEFSEQIEKYRGIVEEALFDRLGLPSFFDEAVDLIFGRIAAKIEENVLEATAEKKPLCAFAPQLRREQGNGKSMCFEPQERGIRGLAHAEVVRLWREIEMRFVETGILELPAAAELKNS